MLDIELAHHLELDGDHSEFIICTIEMSSKISQKDLQLKPSQLFVY